MVLGVAVNGAKASFNNGLNERRSGSSTATTIAAGIAALLIQYTRQHFDDLDSQNIEHIRKLFLAMSIETEGTPTRYLTPWLPFHGHNHRQNIKEIIEAPLGTL